MMKIGYMLNSILLTAFMLFGLSSYGGPSFNDDVTIEEEDAEFNNDISTSAFDFQIDGGGDGNSTHEFSFISTVNFANRDASLLQLSKLNKGNECAVLCAHQPFYILFCELKIASVILL